MTGFDIRSADTPPSDIFSFIIIRDPDDHPRIQKRMQVVEDLYKKRGFSVQTIPLKGKSRFERIFASLILADWTAYYTAEQYGLESEQVPMVEEFKKMI